MVIVLIWYGGVMLRVLGGDDALIVIGVVEVQ